MKTVRGSCPARNLLRGEQMKTNVGLSPPDMVC